MCLTQPPHVLTLAGDAQLIHPQDIAFEEPGFSAEDALEGSIPVTVEGMVDVSTVGTYTPATLPLIPVAMKCSDSHGRGGPLRIDRGRLSFWHRRV